MTVRYRLIADSLRQAVENGAFAPGGRMISARRLAERENVSLPTAVEALRCLEAEGLIVARPRSGFFVRARQADDVAASRPPPMPQAVTMSALARSLFGGSDANIIPLGAALPDPDWLPVAALQRALVGAGRRLGGRTQSYSVPPGHPALRRQVAARAGQWGGAFGPDEIILTAGATQALRLALRAVCRPGDVVAVESPAYFGTLLLLEHCGFQALEIATDPRTGLNVAALAQALQRTRISAIIVSPTVQNPLGACMPIESKRALVELAHNASTPLIEDDVYGDLAGDSQRPPACKAFDRQGTVIYCSSASKLLAPGWRIGWISAGRHHERILQARFAEDWAGAPATEAALAEFLGTGDYDRHLRKLKQRVAAGLAAISARVVESFPAGTRLSRPAAGFLLWVELPATVDALELHRLAQSQGISISPGQLFSPQSSYSHHLRLNCANEATPRLLQAIDRLGANAAALAG